MIEQHIKTVREALEPFAKDASGIHPDWANERRRLSLTGGEWLTVGHIRRAAKALTTLDAIEQAMRETGVAENGEDGLLNEFGRPYDYYQNQAAPPAQQPQETTFTTLLNKQMAQSWLDVTSLLDELAPGWTAFPGTGIESAEAAIRKLAQQPQAEAVTWGVDWGTHGDKTCVSIVKKHPDGTVEVVASEYEPDHPMKKHADAVRHVVGKSRFEGWYEVFDMRGKSAKQLMREAYEAGLNDPLVKQAGAEPK